MKVIANRGVCIGVDRHLKAGDTADLDTATVQFLKSIGAVSEYSEAVEFDLQTHAADEEANRQADVQVQIDAMTADQQAVMDQLKGGADHVI